MSKYNPRRKSYKDTLAIPKKSVDNDIIPQIFAAASEKNIDTLKKILIETDATLDVTDADGNTILHKTLTTEDRDNRRLFVFVKYLLENGVSASTYNKDNVTALHLAARTCDAKIMELLINHGVNINAVDNNGMNALHWATRGQLVDCFNNLMRKSLISGRNNNNILSNDLESTSKKTQQVINKILNKKAFVQYITHIEETMSKMDTMYQNEFETIQNKFRKRYIDMINDSNLKKTKDRLKILLDMEKKGVIDQVTSLCKKKMSSTLKTIDIKPGQLDGWGVGTDDENKVLPENPDKKLDVVIVNYERELLNTLTQASTAFSGIYSKALRMDTDFEGRFIDISDIALYNAALYEYSNIKDNNLNDMRYMNHEDLRELVLHEDGFDDLQFVEIDAPNRDIIVDVANVYGHTRAMDIAVTDGFYDAYKDDNSYNNFLNIYNTRDPSDIKGTEDDIKRWKGQHKKLKQHKLTWDVAVFRYTIQLDATHFVSYLVKYPIFTYGSENDDVCNRTLLPKEYYRDTHKLYNTYLRAFASSTREKYVFDATLGHNVAQPFDETDVAMGRAEFDIIFAPILSPGTEMPNGNTIHCESKRITKLDYVHSTDDRQNANSRNKYKKSRYIAFGNPLGDNADTERDNADLAAAMYTGPAYQFVSKLKFAFSRMVQHLNALRHNNRTLINMLILESSIERPIYYAYHTTITQMQVNIINVCQNIALAETDKDYIDDTISDIRTKYINYKREVGPSHPYAYIYDKIDDRLSNIEKTVEEMYSIMQKTYGKMIDACNTLNGVIDKINELSALIFINNYSNDSFTNDKIKASVGYFDRMFHSLEIIPNSLDGYMNEIGHLRDLDKSRKFVIEKYIPSVNKKHFNTYHYVVGDGDDPTENLYPEDYKLAHVKTTIKLDNTNDIKNYLESIRNLHLTKSVIGYLIYPATDNVEYDATIDITPDGRYVRGVAIPRGFRRGNTTKIVDLSNSINIKYGKETSDITDLVNAVTITGSTMFMIGRFANIVDSREAQLKSSPAPSSIGGNIDLHIDIIKQRIIQNILQMACCSNNDLGSCRSVTINENEAGRGNLYEGDSQISQNIKDIKASFGEIYGGDMVNTDSIIYSTIGKIADQIIINKVQNAISNFATKYIDTNISEFSTKDDNVFGIFKKLTSSAPTRDDGLKLNTTFDTGFKLDMNKVMDSVLKYYYTTKIARGDELYDVSVSGLTMKEKDVLQKELGYKKNNYSYNTDYSYPERIKQQKCYDIDVDGLELLLRNNINVNQKNNIGNTPLFYAVETQNVKVADLLMKYGADSENVINKVSNSPIDKGTNMLNNTLRYITDYKHYPSDYFHYDFYKSNLNILISNSDYSHNILANLDLVFPMLISLYNDQLFSNLFKYDDQWTFEDMKTFVNLNSWSYGGCSDNPTMIPFLTSLEENLNDIVMNSGKVNVMFKKYDEMVDEHKKIEDQISNGKSKIRNLVKEYRSIADRFSFPHYKEDVIRPNHQKTVNNVVDDMMTRDDIAKKMEILDSNMDEAKKQKANNLLSGLYDFYSVHASCFGDVYRCESSTERVCTVDKYDSIFKSVMNYDTAHDPENYDLSVYPYAWRLYLKRDKYCEIEHHTMYSISKIIEKALNTRNKQYFAFILNMIRKKFIPYIKDMRELPQDKYNKMENYALYDTTNMIIHVVKHTLCAPLLIIIKKMIAKYIYTIHNPYNDDEEGDNIYGDNTKYTKKHHGEFPPTIISAIMKSGVDGNIINYVMNDMPKEIVKNLLRLEETENDPVTDDTLGDILNVIIVKLINNPVLPITKESSLVMNIEETIFPYFSDIFRLFVPKMQVVIDNYTRYILNLEKHMQMVILLSK